MPTITVVRPRDLTADHIGKRIRVNERTRVIEGWLTEIHHSAETIQIHALCDPPENPLNIMLGEIETTIEVGGVTMPLGRSMSIEVLS